MTSPTYAELVAQVAELTAARAKPLTIDDLPLRDLRSKLIDNGDPLDLSVLALPGQAPKFRVGVATLTWPGGSPFSNSLTVKHDLEVTPTVVIPVSLWTAFTAADFLRLQPRTITSTDFILTASTGDDSNYGAGTTRTVMWLAFV